MSHYEINVSLNGRHLFATHERSIQTADHLEKVILLFLEKFPEDDGYKVSVSYSPGVSRHVDIKAFLGEQQEERARIAAFRQRRRQS